MRVQILFSAAISFLFLAAIASPAWAWPTDAQWLAVAKGTEPIHDPNSDAQGARNVVPESGSLAAAYIFNDGVNIYFRFRLDADPSGQGGQGLLQPYGWGFEIDTDQNADDYEWLMMCDGITSPEIVALRENTEKSHLGDPSDTAERIAAQYPLEGNYRVLAAGSCFDSKNNPSGACDALYTYHDYFLDYKIPYSVFKSATGITDQTVIRFFVGSSSAANNLTENGADLVAGSNLYQMGTDFVTPFGHLPATMTFYDGIVRFVNDLNGAFDRTVGATDAPLYIRVDDLDLNSQTNPSDVVVVTVTSPTGDSERVTLYATGVQGKYTGSLPISATTNTAGTLYVLNGQTATVTYIDAITASRTQSISRTDTIYMTTAGTDIAIQKNVDNPAPREGETVIFTVFATNNGPGAVTASSINDPVPAGLTYVSHTVTQGTYDSGTGVWAIDSSLAAGATATLTLRATVNAGTNGQTWTNIATLASSAPGDLDAGNNTASAAVRIGGTDLRVTKSVDQPLPAAGATIVYSVRVLNLGPAATDDVRISDLLPAGVTYVNHTTTAGTYSPIGSEAGLWKIDSLANGAGALLTITATVNYGTTGQTITNEATLVGSSQPDINASNNIGRAAIRVEFVDLQLTKQVRRFTPTATGFGGNVAANTGNTVEFRVDVRNNGPHTATGIGVADSLPIGLSYIANSATVTHGSIGSIGAWNLGELASGSTATLLFRATVDNGTAGQTIVNEAQITTRNQPDSNPGDESDLASVAVNGTDLRITKSVDNPTPNPGQSVTWTVTVYNDGPNAATNVTVSDRLPTGLTRSSHATSQGTWAATGGNPSWVWSIGNLNVGASAILTVVTTVNAGTTGQTIANDAFITGSSQADPEDANNVASAHIYIGGTDLTIVKTVDDSTPNVGQHVVYNLTVTNEGPADATSVVVNDLLPPEVRYVSHSSPSGHNVYDSSTGVWTLGNLTGGTGTATLYITAEVLNEDSHLLITNQATVTAAQADPDPFDNTATVDILVNAADLAISKTVENGISTPTEGQTLVYIVSVLNAGSNIATGVEVEDVLPAGVTLVSAEPSQGNYSAGIWLVGPVAGGTAATLRLTVTVNPFTAGTTITNTATLIALDQIDADASNNRDSYSIVPRQVPVLTILKSANGKVSAAPGEVITYTVTVLNVGSAVATVVRLNDRLSPYTAWQLDFNNDGAPDVPFNFDPGSSGLALGTPEFFDRNGAISPVSGGGGAPAGYDGRVTEWRLPLIGNMAVGGSFTLHYRVRVK